MHITPAMATTRTPKVRAVKKGEPKLGKPAKSKLSNPNPVDEVVTAKPRRKTLTKKIPAIDLAPMIATAAYFLAERRDFTPGHELDDWLTAERQLRAELT